ncbi:MAG TPA: hypothetical protein DCM87_15600 [Planctomycetes bacterium]|nr:hypothetical protein [Planctomycetota bacterium]
MFIRRLFVAAGVLLPILVQAQSFSVRFGETAGQPGEIVKLKVFGDFDVPLYLACLPFQFEPDIIEPLAYSVENTAAAGAPAGATFLQVQGNEGVCGISPVLHTGIAYFSVPAGRDVCIGELVLRIRADVLERRSIVTPTTRFAGRISAVVNLGELGVTTHPDRYWPGAVTVLPPQGPRPVGDVVCRQFLNRIQLSFTLTEEYETIEINRGGTPIAVLAGTERSYEETMPGMGRAVYTLIAHRGGAASIPVTCEVMVTTPAAPDVRELACNGDRLSWTNPVSFERIVVLRDRAPLAELPGTADTFVDPGAPDTAAIYTVISHMGGFSSPGVNCIANGTWGLEVGDVQAPADAPAVTVPVYATTLAPVQGFSLVIAIDETRFTLVEDAVEAIRDTVLYQNPDFLILNHHVNSYGMPTLAVIFDMVSPLEQARHKYLQPGLRQRIANVTFLVKDAPGSREDAVFALAGDGTTLTSGGKSAPLVFMLDGRVRFGASPTEPVADLAAGFAPAARRGPLGYVIQLTWRNRGAYEQILVERNGTEIAVLAGDASRYRDEDVPGGVYTYKVTAFAGGATSFPADVFLSTISPPNAFLRCDANRDGRIDLADVMFSVMFLFRGTATPRCEDAMDSNDDGALTIADPIFTLTHLFGGGVIVKSPGARYPWFDPTDDALTCLE